MSTTKDLHENIHCNFTDNSSKAETAQMFINIRINKQWHPTVEYRYIHTHKLLKAQMDESQKHHDE